MARRAPINRRMVTREASDTIVLFRDAWGEVDKLSRGDLDEKARQSR